MLISVTKDFFQYQVPRDVNSQKAKIFANKINLPKQANFPNIRTDWGSK